MNKYLRKEKGFTLLEVMVALTILGIGLGIMLQLFSGSLKSVRKSEQYTNAVFLARQKMEEWVQKTKLEESAESGIFSNDFSDFSWQVEVKPYEYTKDLVKGELSADSQMLISMLQIKVSVTWREGEKDYQVNLETLRTKLKKETLFLS